jgi:carbamoyl-phosphate synthase large subunit
MKIFNVLVFPGGTEIGLEIQRAMCQCKDVQLFSAGSDISNHAPYVFARHFATPTVYESVWIDRLNQIVAQQNIDYIFPAYDDIVVALAQNASRINAKIISSPLETCMITRSKTLTYRYFGGKIPVPVQYADLDSIEQYPIFLKPDNGQGSAYTHIVYNKQQLACLFSQEHNHIMLEYLPGEEYTIDCFSDRDQGLLFCGGRQRIRTKSGISMHSRPILDPLFNEYAQVIASELRFYGAWFFQLKKDRQGTYRLLEIAPRIAGTMALHRGLGVNLALLSLYEQERVPIKILKNDMYLEIDRSLINRYSHQIKYTTAYIDFDDTLIFNGQINTELVQFLFQCINAKVRLILLTKHVGDVNVTLQRYRLAGIFDDIVHLHHSGKKSDYINPSNAILIDDSFIERKSVEEKLGMLTFDCSMLEVLIEHRK